MSEWLRVAVAWDWEPSVVVGCAALVAVYVAGVRARLQPRSGLFLAGVLVLLLDLVSPIDVLSDHYLFSAHMLQHLLMVLVVPPLLLAGIPVETVRRALDVPAIRRVEAILGRPAIAWACGVGTMWAWHVPALYNAALASEGVHIVEHLFLLVGATVFWWPIFGRPSAALEAPARLLYLFLGCLATTLLGIILTFAPAGLYPLYLHPDDVLGVLGWLRGVGLSPEVDQHVGGLLMWVPGGLLYLAAMLVVFVRWHEEPEADVERLLAEETHE